MPKVFLLLALLCGFAYHAQAQQRVVSLSPHLTEAVFWLGAGDNLKGRDRFSDYPAAARNIPVVGDAYSLNIEALLNLKPDLVLLWQAPQQLKSQLNRHGIKYFNTEPQNVEQVLSELNRLALALGQDATPQLRRLAQKVDHLKATTTHVNKKALILVQAQPPIALAMGDTLANSLRYCGWENAFLDQQAALSINPEYLLLGDFQAIINLTGQRLSNHKTVAVLSPEMAPLVRPGPRFVSALEALCQQLL